MGALSKLDDFLLNPQLRTFSGTVSGKFRNAGAENKEASGHRSQNDPHPEVEFSACCASNLSLSDTNETSHVVTGVQEKIPYYYPGTFSTEQKKARSITQPHFCSENTPATIEGDQILLALQKMTKNSPNPLRKQGLF